MRHSCPEIYSSPCLDLIFLALLEIQPKLSRNAGIYLNSARNPGQFWSVWRYLSLATLPRPDSPAHERGFCSPPCPTSIPTSQGAQGCLCSVFTGMCFGAALCSSIPPVPSHWGWWQELEEQSRAQHTPPEGPTPQENSCPSPAHHLLLQLTRGWPAHLETHKVAFQSENTVQGRHFLHFPCNMGCAGWEEWLVIALWEQKCSFHSGLSNAWRLGRSVHSGNRWTHHFSKLAQQHGSSPQCMSTDLCTPWKQPIWSGH